MTTGRKVLFAVATVLVLFGLLEGAAQLVWWRLQTLAFDNTKIAGEKVLRNDAINYIKQSDGILGYVLKPGVNLGGTYINRDGFAQRETLSLSKPAGTLRLAALGESTTQGHDVDTANYPVYLRRRMQESGRSGTHVEMINGGVSGWISDQVALWAEKKVHAYQPDIVVLYVGWNDFQSYDPFGRPSLQSYFDQHYGNTRLFVDSSPIKLVIFASAAYSHYSRKAELRKFRHAAKSERRASDETSPLKYRTTPIENYHFFLRSLDRIVAAFQNQGSKVHVAICTLVGRWPYGTEAEFQSDYGGTWWMKLHGLEPVQAAAALDRFNGLIRDYAKDRGLVLIDAADSFAHLDRAKLQLDFAHFTQEGYELLAEAMYEGLRSAGIVKGDPSARYEQLRAKYGDERKAKNLTKIVEPK
jgi:lysophospholipase L1-like esterase